MSFREHSSMFKSKSGSHLLKDEHRDRVKAEKKANRLNNRHDLLRSHRNIEPTPKRLPKPVEPSSSNEFANETTADVASAITIERKVVKRVADSEISRQQAFRERFKQYLEKKQVEKAAKKTVKPFVSAAPTGRFVLNPEKQKPKAKRTVSKQMERALAISDTPKFSPINTRSKKLKLLSPSLLPTPKRNKRKSTALKRDPTLARNVKKSVKDAAVPERPVITAKRTLITATITKPSAQKTPIREPKTPIVKPSAAPVLPRGPILPNTGAIRKVVTERAPIPAPKAAVLVNTGAVKKVLNTRDVVKTNIKTAAAATTKPARKIPVQPTKSKQTATKPSTSKGPMVKKEIVSKKPLSAFQMGPPRLPDSFVFEPKAIGPVVTSTVVRPRRSSKSTRVSSTKQLFNESISPIENCADDGLPATAPETPPPNEKNNNDAVDTTPANRIPIESNYVSPFVTINRGGARNSMRKEKEAREKKYALESRKSIDLNESVEDRQHKEAAAYFRGQVKRVSDEFVALIDQWTKYRDEHTEDGVIPSEYVDSVNVAIGQTRLLITSKFKQFSTLVDQCEANNAVNPVKAEDLEGFWSMVNIQVDNCHGRFKRLEVLKANDWIDPALKVQKEKKIRKESNSIIKNKSSSGPSTMRPNATLAKMLKEARLKYKESKENSNVDNNIFVMGTRKSILSNVLLNSSKRRSSTPRKSIWVVEDNKDNASQTPARSILKTPGSIRKTGKKSLQFKSSPQVKLFSADNEIEDN